MRQRRRINLGSGLVVLLGWLLAAGVLLGVFLGGGFDVILYLLSDWVAVLVAFALLLGLGNVARVHLGRVARRHEGWFYSLVLIVSALIVLGLGLYEGTPGGPLLQWIFNYIYQPLGASVFALLAFFVLTAALRTLRAGPSAAWVLLAVAVIVLIGAAPWSRVAPLDPLAGLYDWIMQVPVLAGVRGLLLGAALGAAATSLRVILGYDRPYAS